MKKVSKKDLDNLFLVYLQQQKKIGYLSSEKNVLSKEDELENAIFEYKMSIVEDTFYRTMKFAQTIYGK